jgi:uroporphyrinogen-III synthase
MKSVLVTRPEPGATRTAEQLAALGFHPLVLPLTVIRPLPVQLPDRQYDAVAVTSANALHHVPQHILSRLYPLPCFAVGEATAELARSMGFKRVVQGSGDGVSLASKVNDSVSVHASLLYLTGQVRSSCFEKIVSETGRAVTAVAVYDTILKDYESEYLTELFNAPVDACLLYSVKGAEAFIDAIKKADIYDLFENTEILCLSARIAAVVSGRNFGRVRTAIAPKEAALFELLRV